MKRVITSERMQRMEREFLGAGSVTGLALMERAAGAVADALLRLPASGALFLCGPGNNGGDGYAAARLYAGHGKKAWIWTLSNPEMLTGDAKINMERCKEMKIPIRRLFDLHEPAPEGCEVVVDALFGTGLARPLDGIYAEAVRWINECGLSVLAVDIPSGDASLMVRADLTISFHQMKTQHLLFPGRANTGKLSVVDIGIPYDASEEDFAVLDEGDIPALLRPRALDAHKGSCGHAIIVAGSPGMAGAAALSAGGALRGGAGLVTVACPKEIIPIVQTLAPCAMCADIGLLREHLEGKAAAAAGPGLGKRTDAMDGVLERLLQAQMPQVWDADALNWLADQGIALSGRFVITPHPGEAGRLLGAHIQEVVRDPVAAAEELHRRYGAVVLLKGATTIILDEKKRAMNITGSPGMATGGSGDVLTGLIAALLAQGIEPFTAAQLGAWIHGKAGEAAAGAHGIRSMIAQDILGMLCID